MRMARIRLALHYSMAGRGLTSRARAAPGRCLLVECAGAPHGAREEVSMTDDARDQPLLLATTNPHKVREYEAILAGLPLRLLTPADLGLADDVEETGATFLENARLKATAYRAAAQARGVAAWVLADDSGIEVEALDAAPGVYSTRWAGPD